MYTKIDVVIGYLAQLLLYLYGRGMVRCSGSAHNTDIEWTQPVWYSRISYAIRKRQRVEKSLLISWFLLSVAAGTAMGQSGCVCDYVVDKAGVYTNAKLNVKPGQTVCVKAGRYDYLRFNGFVGTASQPIRFINCGGLVSVGVDAYYSGIQFNTSRYFVLSGSGDPSLQYGFKLDRSNQSASGVSIGGLSSDCEVERVEVAFAGFAGFMVKTDPSCDSTTWRENFSMYNVSLHDNYVHDTGGEGFYIGHSYYTGVNVTCNGIQKTVYPHLIYGLRVYNNRIEHTAAEGLQYGCAPDAQVHHNTLDYTGMAPFANYQNNGIQIGGGGGGDCYSNQLSHVAGIGLIIVGHLGNNRIYNNVINDASLDGIFCDDRVGSLPNTSMLFANNTINRTGRDGIRLYNQNNTNLIVNNAITQVNAQGSQGGRVLTLMQGAQATLVTNVTAVAGTTLYTDESADFRPAPGSPLVGTGTNVSNLGVITDLPGNNREDGSQYDVGAYKYAPVSSAGARQAAPMPELTAASSELLLYPSPAHSYVSCQLPAGQAIQWLTIYSQQGTVVSTVVGDHASSCVDVSVDELPSGTYTVVMLSAGGKRYTSRFIRL
ncbi:putative secreted protein (Por secretion system target) [Spirosoma oryzae]|uniref:Putative secreted protein (Por secretion system target) n=1 Tax=Spirosoma oryzae TaxID=1469603 RepID=A0A2T0S6Y2_9BACT|nr:right-handed parallel beta-helix repeat-containing protein [Spirosoma oryzae]PRY29063.1 putative secreted protein (Por secretion system target) [Spirosoma oryzae]